LGQCLTSPLAISPTSSGHRRYDQRCEGDDRANQGDDRRDGPAASVGGLRLCEPEKYWLIVAVRRREGNRGLRDVVRSPDAEAVSP
jgi:hypothetical protein